MNQTIKRKQKELKEITQRLDLMYKLQDLIESGATEKQIRSNLNMDIDGILELIFGQVTTVPHFRSVRDLREYVTFNTEPLVKQQKELTTEINANLWWKNPNPWLMNISMLLLGALLGVLGAKFF